MSVPSFEFLAFALVAAVLFNLRRAAWWRGPVMAITNLAFFSTFLHGPLSALPFAVFLLAGYGGLRLIQSGAKQAVVPCILAVLAAFVWLKRYAFLPEASFLPFAYTTIGLSYVFFRVLHLIIDAGSDELPGRVGPLSYLNYTLNFTALVAGPIQFYQDYHRCEAVEPASLDIFDAGHAVQRIIVGFFKVAIVSTLLSGLRNDAIGLLDTPLPFLNHVLTLIAVVGLYPLFLYANFSGYTDAVIGVARFFRLQLPENFNDPFASANFIEFWSRWHISLSTWLKTYVYNPVVMTGMRRFTSRPAERLIGVSAFFVTFFLVGVWHGQTSEFLVFGILQGGGVAVNKLYQLKMVDWLGRKGYRAVTERPVYRAVCRGLTFSWFAFTLTWFASDWAQMAHLVHGAGVAEIVMAAVLAVALATLVLSVVYDVGVVQWVLRRPLRDRYVCTAFCTALLVVIVGATVIADGPAPDIVYKTF